MTTATKVRSKSQTVHELEAIVPPEMSTVGAPAITIAGQTFVAEEARAFKVAEAIRILFSSNDEASVRNLVGFIMAYFQATDDADGTRAQKRQSLLPWIMSEVVSLAPTVSFELLALLSIPNAALREAARVPNGIRDAVNERREFFQFEATAGEVMQALDVFLPTLRLDALKNAVGPVLGRLADMAQSVLGPTPTTNGASAPSDGSTNSPSANGA